MTKLGAIAVTVGSAVGLGNIWRFPFEAGSHGGGVFIFFYLLFTLLLGLPLICGEFILGRSSGSNFMDAYKRHSPDGYWHYMGYLGIIGSLLILGFYSVVAGWTLYYFIQSLAGGLESSRDMLHSQFVEFSGDGVAPLVCTLVFLTVNFFVVGAGVNRGIEKVSNFLMPVLFLLLVIFCVNSLTMPKAPEGVSFLFNPDFSNVDSTTVISALGQSFFSLSLGIGTMATYASYFPSHTRLGRTALVTAMLDMLVAVLAGLIIFPAVFSFGFSPEAGPALVFEVLPAIFHEVAGGGIWSVLFFALLMIASLTSTISMSEIPIKFLIERCSVGRLTATVIVAVVSITLGAVCALSFGVLSGVTLFGMTFFSLFDYVASNIIMPVGGIVLAIFVGWIVDRRVVEQQMLSRGCAGRIMVAVLRFSLRYVAPAGIFMVFLNSLGLDLF